MNSKFEIKSSLSWADGYEDAENYEGAPQDDDDETVRDLAAAHELWVAMLKYWTEAGAYRQLETTGQRE
jgi:hypothetical protein